MQSYKLSPNEEAAVLRSQREERRKARLVQVREQEREASRKTREEQRRKREKERKLLQDHIQSHLLVSHAAELAAVQKRYTSATRHIGLAHRQAQKVELEENRLHELRLLLAAKQRERAEDRYVAAMREELSYHHQRKGEKKRQVERLKLTRDQEGRRARETATRAPHHQPPIIMDLVADKGRRVRLREVEGYSSSYYHMPSCTVQRAEEIEGPDAQKMAELMSEEMQNVDKQCSAVQEEQRELARLRHIHALNKVKMEKEKQVLLQQLKTLEREDRILRQKALASMPSSMYQPVEQRKEVVREQQRDMEQAFERLFVETHGNSTHPTLLHIANPTPDPITPTPPSSHPPSSSSQETTPTNYQSGDGPNQKAHKNVHVTVPTVKFNETDHSDSTSSVVTPSSFSTSIRSSISITADKEEYSDAQTRHRVPFNKSSGPNNQLGGVSRGIGMMKGGDELENESELTCHATDSSSVTDAALSTPHQQPQQGPGELSVSELTPSEVHCSTEDQPPPQTTTAALPIKPSGMKRLMSMVHAQQQAWSQRVATRPAPAESSSGVHRPSPVTSHTLPPPSLEPNIPTNTEEPPSLSVYTLLSGGSRGTSVAASDGGKRENMNEGVTRHLTHEAWSKLPHPPNYSSYTHPLSTLQPTASHPPKQSTLQPPSQVLPSPQPPNVLSSSRQGVDPLSITGYESTFNTSGEQSFQQQQKSTSPRQSLQDLQLPHLITPSTADQLSVSKMRDPEEIKQSVGNDQMSGDLEDVECDVAVSRGSHVLSSPPLVTEPQSEDTLHSSQYTSWSDSGTNLSADTPTAPSGAQSTALELPPPPAPTSLSLAPRLPVFTLSSHEFTPPQSHVPPQDHTSQSTPPQSNIFTTPHHHPMSISQCSESVIAPSTLSSLNQTPTASFLQDPSPIADPVGHSCYPRQDTDRQAPTDVSDIECPGRKRENAPSCSQGLIISGSDAYKVGGIRTSLPRPDLSMATEDTDPGQHTAPYPDMNSEIAQSLDTTPTHTTLHLPGDESESDPSISTTTTAPSDPNVLLSHTFKPHISSDLVSHPHVSPSSQKTAPSLNTQTSPPLSDTSTAIVTNSLQEAFLKQKKDFVQQSRKRLEQLKSNASERRIQSSLKPEQRHGVFHSSQNAAKSSEKTDKWKQKAPGRQSSSLHPPPTSTSGKHSPLPNNSECDRGGKENKKRAVTFSSPVLCSSHSSCMFSPPLEHKAPGLTQRKEKISTKEMRKRNQRFYDRLPEVRRRKLEEKRSAVYASNRQKVRIYQEQVRAEMQKKPLRLHTMTKKPPFK